MTGTEPLLHVALVEPEIPPNTGNVARLCAANRLRLHLVGRLGFRIDDRSLRRAGLDYWPLVDLCRERDLEELRRAVGASRIFFFSARAERPYTSVRYRPGDCLAFGPEGRGLDPRLLEEHAGSALAIPMLSDRVRSLNLSTAAGIAVYEALRQIR